ncbi:glycosyltransferase [Methanobrevibacter sp.]|uniref:glycosyltransferase n=1 Tax=Methanobrevibacter sp. TaxID=66852 RepID=UPI00388E8FFA
MNDSNLLKKILLEDIDAISSAISDKSKDEIKENFGLLNSWVKNCAIFDLTDSDKYDVLRYSKDIIVKFRPFCHEKAMNTFVKMISRNRILDALEILKIMSYSYNEKKEPVKNLVKQKKIFILSPKLAMEMGGLGHIVVHRACYLAGQGYDVTMLNVGPIQNYGFIKKFYDKRNPLFEKVKFYNFIEYYSIKNSNSSKNPNLEIAIKESRDEYKIEKELNDDNSITLTYYVVDDLIKTEKYIDDCLIFSENNNLRQYFTFDGFKFLELDKNTNQVFLHERESGLTLEFNHKNVFLNHFLTEVCLMDDDKPFIICDSGPHWYNMNAVSLNKAIKIGCLHGNPFKGFNPKNGISPKINHLQRMERFHKIVLLTESLKNDLKSYVDMEKIAIIPNFLNDEFLEYDHVDKDLDKIAVFSRISPGKQMSHMIEAFNVIAQENDTIHLDIYGGAESVSEMNELENLKKMAKDYNIEDRVRFMGYIDDVHPEMRKTFFTLLTSKNEGLSVSKIELMGDSTPIISYDIKYGPSDIIENDVDGVLLEEGDIDGLVKAMRSFINNPDKTLQMGINAKEKIKNNFSMSAVCPLWEDLFIELYIEDEMERIQEKLNLKDDYNSLVRTKKEILKENEKLEKENKELVKFKNEVLSSKSWKITKPLRKLKNS